jgi:uncharacterized protein with FMN-binding domain
MDEYPSQLNNKPNISKILIPLAAIVIIIGIATFITRGGQKNNNSLIAENPGTENNIPAATGDEITTPENQNEIIDNEADYKDGVYTATGNYISPGGDEELGVQITLVDNVITVADVELRAKRPNSVRYQGIFVSNYNPLVVGKRIDEVKLNTVSGSSLSPRGFNEALSEIKEQAKS